MTASDSGSLIEIESDQVRQAVALYPFDAVAAWMTMAPAGREQMQPNPQKPPRESAVLVLVFPVETADHDRRLQLVLTRRTAHLSGHSGQISFPGGRCDDADDNYEDTALRETCEELGICKTNRLTILGRLTTIWIPPSNYNVVPVVAMLPYAPDFIPNPYEVAEVLTLPLRDLLDDTLKKTKPMTLRGMTYSVPYYDVDGHIVWGATAMMLSELEQRLRAVRHSRSITGS